MTNSELFKMHHQTSQSLSLIRKEIEKRDINWRHLAGNGLIVEAIMALRKKNPTLSLTEANDCVDAFLAM